MVDARYHFVCCEHGACGSLSIRRRPDDRRCPVCGQTVEVWVGVTPPAILESSQPIATRLPRAS